MLGPPHAAFAAEQAPSPPPQVTAVPDLTARRFLYLQSLLDSERQRAAVWTWSWVTTYGAVTAAQVAIAATIADKNTRTDLIIGSVSSLIGALGLAVIPLSIPTADGLPADATGLKVAERLLHEGANKEAFGVSWMAQVGNFAVNLVIALIMGVGYKHWESAGISFGAGVALGEITIFTRPVRLMETQKLWDAGLLSSLTVQPQISDKQGGLALSLAW
jgi:hypothetical protein